jgi:hypothetical protein
MWLVETLRVYINGVQREEEEVSDDADSDDEMAVGENAGEIRRVTFELLDHVWDAAPVDEAVLEDVKFLKMYEESTPSRYFIKNESKFIRMQRKFSSCLRNFNQRSTIKIARNYLDFGALDAFFSRVNGNY